VKPGANERAASTTYLPVTFSFIFAREFLLFEVDTNGIAEEA